MPRYKIVIAYDGTNYLGWQIQKKGQTIQRELECTLSILNRGEQINVVGSGRTDSGVHAVGQVAHFDWQTNMPTCDIISALNGNLPVDIRIRSCTLVPDDFHARFSAVSRYYLYRCRTDDNLMERHAIWQTGDLALDVLNEAAACIIGKHDFTSFSKTNSETENRVCKIQLSEWSKSGKIVYYLIAGNRFLHHMVRYLVGTMVEISKNRMTLREFKEKFYNPQDNVRIAKAPAHGLYLQQIDYDDADTY